ncbi:MAG: hypothetical protein PF517_05875 [Salinivirgaceae bacterium]|jgi:hypothetical protein|nr:hypothetical protein [Salinivirgaceae bacterium]
MKLYITIAAIFLTCTLINAQQIDVQVVYNNTADIKANTETINKIKSAVKTSELQAALNSNGHITDKNLIIRVTFFDRGVIGQLKLKAEHELTPEGYIEKWQETVKNKSGILFLFIKNKGKSQYDFNKLYVSDQLELEHLFPLVVEFVNENLSGDFTTIIGNGTKYLAKAMTPIWNVDDEGDVGLKKEVVDITNISSYPEFHKGYSNSVYNCYDFEPYHFIWPDHEDLGAERDYDYIHKLSSYTNYNGRVDDQILKIEEWGYHGDVLVSGWPWNVNGDLESVSEEGDYHAKLSEHSENESSGTRDFEEGENYCRLNMISSTTQKGEQLSIYKYKQIWGYQPTWCNQFANYISQNLLFNHIPWQSSGYRASQIHDYVSNSKQFKKVTFEEAWEYTNVGYVVYFTSYHSSGVNYNSDGTVNYWSSSPGHIATCFPTGGEFEFLEGYLVQAGGFDKTRRLIFKDAWSANYGVEREKVSAHIYMGYLKLD